MEEAFRSVLQASAPLLNHVPLHAINWGAHPQGGPVPYIVLHTISDTEAHTLSGPDGLSTGRVQVNVYAASYAASKIISRIVRSEMDGYSGGGFQGVFLVGNQDTREGGANEAERLFRVSLDFTTHFNMEALS